MPRPPGGLNLNHRRENKSIEIILKNLLFQNHFHQKLEILYIALSSGIFSNLFRWSYARGSGACKQNILKNLLFKIVWS